MELAIGLRWFMGASFVVVGLGLLIGRNHLASDGVHIRTADLEEPAAGRLKRAIARRELMEVLPSATPASVVGVCALVAAALVAFTRLDPIVLYAGLCTVLAMAFSHAYLRLRNAGTRRAAALRVRNRATVLPPWLWIAVALCVVTPLAFFDVAPLAAIFVSAAAVTIAVVGDRVTRLPALMSGEDPPIEDYLDRRLRTLRAANVVTTAPAPAYLFVCWAIVSAPDFTGLHLTAFGVAMVTELIVTAWFLKLQVAGAGPEAGRKRT